MRRGNKPTAGGATPPRPSPFSRRSSLSLSPFQPFHLWKGKYFAPLAGILIALIIFLLSYTRMVEIFEWRTLDMRFQHRGTRPIKSDLVVVFIGDDSIQAFGRWPWSWDYHALLVDILKRHGARTVVFDILFAEQPDTKGQDVFPLAVKAAGNVFLSSYFNDLEPNPVVGLPRVGLFLTEPVPSLRAGAKGIGHCNAEPDEDGITRRIPLLVRYSDGYYPSTALLVALDRLGMTPQDIRIEPGRSITIPMKNREPVKIPLDESGQTLVNFAGGLYSFEQYSYLQILQADLYPEKAVVDLERLRGKTVLVGVTFGGNTDIRPTPIDKAYPLICVLGNTIDNILNEDFIHRAGFASRLAFLILLGALTAFLTYVLRPAYSLANSVFFFGAVIYYAAHRFEQGQVWVDIIAPLATVLSSYLVMTTVQYIQNRREKIQYLEYLKYMDDLVESSSDAIVSFDMEGRINTWNKGAEKIFGWLDSDARGKKWDILAAAPAREKVSDAVREVLAGGQPRILETTGAWQGHREFPLSMTLSPVKDSRGIMVGVSCISQDLTERKKMVEMLIQSEKLAELGRLGSGIVHEIKNPLTSIMMLSGMILAMENLDPKSKKYISIIDQEAQRILRLSQNILSFARPKKPEMKPIELNQVIEETLSLVEYELKKNKVNLKLSLREGGVNALGDDEKLKQVFLNLIINAVHAMEGGGNLEITTGVMDGSGPPPAPEGFHSQAVGESPGAGGALVTIADEGSGIRPETLKKIFEPFFTTKAEGKGTGLGLYISRNIILEHHGRLAVSSRLGMGTVFYVAIPETWPAPAGAGEG